MDKQPNGKVRVVMSFGDLAGRAREVVTEALKSLGRAKGDSGETRKPERKSGRRIEQAKAEAIRRAQKAVGRGTEAAGRNAASADPAERLRLWSREFFRHARRFGWASELLQSEDWRKAGRALAEERLRDSAIHLAQAGLRVGSQGLGMAIGGMLGAETGPGAAVATWAGATFLGALGDRAASALDVHLTRSSRRRFAEARGRER
ncbi:hypothetical protein MAMC_01895 [Methylacidimicrobium cyclopophantes]|uniref:Uncharacterized protein n=1 Tax=Methylacidimicrobium cyclopophantes TaxID=1041766 RepID=A0A5E6MI86_9BACT|nr:hypothetical protein [Methylacidimicrobium cyclopophantes]VVM07943.1 hypothetical protein MAMC_01895 [Methylacidimicrobium cyclopophantes]